MKQKGVLLSMLPSVLLLLSPRKNLGRSRENRLLLVVLDMFLFLFLFYCPESPLESNQVPSVTPVHQTPCVFWLLGLPDTGHKLTTIILFCSRKSTVHLNACIYSTSTLCSLSTRLSFFRPKAVRCRVTRTCLFTSGACSQSTSVLGSFRHNKISQWWGKHVLCYNNC